MKFLVLAALTLSLSNVAQAQSSVSTNLPEVKDVSIEIIGGGGIAAVQPYTMINVTINSCAVKSLDIQTTQSGSVTYIEIVDLQPIDCEAIGTDRVYKLQVNSDARNFKYVVKNPIAPTYIQ